MDRTSRLARTASWVLLILQLLVAGVVPVLDARAEAESLGAVAHVEALGAADCPQVHHQADCQLCRVLRPMATAVAPVGPPPCEQTRDVPATAVLGSPHATDWATNARPRAPPPA